MMIVGAILTKFKIGARSCPGTRGRRLTASMAMRRSPARHRLCGVVLTTAAPWSPPRGACLARRVVHVFGIASERDREFGIPLPPPVSRVGCALGSNLVCEPDCYCRGRHPACGSKARLSPKSRVGIVHSLIVWRAYERLQRVSELDCMPGAQVQVEGPPVLEALD
jgi:hypothetical protein